MKPIIKRITSPTTALALCFAALGAPGTLRAEPDPYMEFFTQKNPFSISSQQYNLDITLRSPGIDNKRLQALHVPSQERMAETKKIESILTESENKRLEKARQQLGKINSDFGRAYKNESNARNVFKAKQDDYLSSQEAFRAGALSADDLKKSKAEHDIARKNLDAAEKETARVSGRPMQGLEESLTTEIKQLELAKQQKLHDFWRNNVFPAGRTQQLALKKSLDEIYRLMNKQRSILTLGVAAAAVGVTAAKASPIEAETNEAAIEEFDASMNDAAESTAELE